jgi:hypothetical protein
MQTVHGEVVHTETHIEGRMAIKRIRFPHANYEERVQLYHRDELQAMLLEADLKVTAILNDYEGHPWQPDGQRQLFLCERLSR